jgi:DNA repair exonuclease SbcCD nuclease subunit
MEQIKFIHIADLHLGKRQYNLSERYKDYFRAFNWILNHAIEQKVDFILIAGDIFDNKNINPTVLSDLIYIIRDFKQGCNNQLKHDIPIICIEGNHDNPIYSSQSWMTLLADLGFLILLSGNYNKDSKTFNFKPYSEKNHRGGVIQIKDALIYGVPYFGSYTENILPAIKQAIPKEDSKINILAMHFGIEGQDKIKPGIKKETKTLRDLHEHIDYLALGHYHKQYFLPPKNPWIFNPGSLELNDLRELSYVRGAFLATISGKEYFKQDIKSLNCDNGITDPDLIPNRRFIQVSKIDISTSTSFEESIKLVLVALKKFGVPVRVPKSKVDGSDLSYPIVFFPLIGEVGYSRLEINTNMLREEIKKNFAILDVKISTRDLFSRLDQITVENDLTFDEIEREVLFSLIKENKQFSDRKDELFHLLNDLKSELTRHKPNYSMLKEKISEWTVQNVADFKKPEERKVKVEEPKEATVSKELKEKMKKDKALQAKIAMKQKTLKALKEKPKEEVKAGFGYDDFGVDLDEFIDDGNEKSEEEK